jgi:hypothetical protein
MQAVWLLHKKPKGVSYDATELTSSYDSHFLSLLQEQLCEKFLAWLLLQLPDFQGFNLRWMRVQHRQAVQDDALRPVGCWERVYGLEGGHCHWDVWLIEQL